MTEFFGPLTLVGSHDSFLSTVSRSAQGFSDGSVDKRIHLQCRRHRRCRFDPWVRKIPWRRKWKPTPVFLPEKNLMDKKSLVGYSPKDIRESDRTE